MTDPEYDASDASVPPIGSFTPMWLDITDPVTGETTTLDVADGGPHPSGETFTITWNSSGIFSTED